MISFGRGDVNKEYMTREAFFSEVCVKAINNRLIILDGDRYVCAEIKITDWLFELSRSCNSIVVFIEGYAGCGKSIFVQYLLKEQLKTLDYDYSYYNYDIGAYYNSKGYHCILNVIRKYFLEQFAASVIKEAEVIKRFDELIRQKSIEYLDNDNQLYRVFIGSRAYKEAITKLENNKDSFDFVSRMSNQIRNLNNRRVHSPLLAAQL